MSMRSLSSAEWLIVGRFILMGIEMLLIKGHLVRGQYEWRDTLASIGMRAGNYLSNVALAGAVVAVFAFLYEHRLFEISSASPLAWVALFFLDDFAYYWFHRASHECRFWWAAHVNHHSSQHYNLSTAIRQPWTGVLAGTWAPWFPLVLIGFPPEMIMLQSGLSLLYQFWLHTETIHRLPRWFEYLFNTPSHHRVHHAANPRYVDRNYSGTLMVWDRLFGTFAQERDDEPCRYGLINNINTFNPIKIAFHEWLAMGRDVLRARSAREVVAYIFGPPGWRPDGRGPTAKNVRANWLTATQQLESR